MSVARAFFRALNVSDAAALAGLYHASCTVEHVFAGDPAVYDGRDAVAARWIQEIDRFSGALPGGLRVDVRRIAGIETGWGWVQADWIRGVCDRRTGQARFDDGYSHFWIEDGRIRRHRSVVRQTSDAAPLPSASPPAPDPGARRYPSHPIVGIGAVIVDAARRVVLVKRQYEPLAGQWSLPGGRLELGESLEAGAAREAREETGLVVDVGPVVDVFDRILVDDAARVRYHYVLIDYLCRPLDGVLAAGGDVVDAVWVEPNRLPEYRLTEMAAEVIQKALAAVIA